MIISENTEQIAHSHQLHITRGYELKFSSRCSHFTRFQKKIYHPIEVILPPNTNVLTIMDIVLNIMDNCHGIQHHKLPKNEKYNLQLQQNGENNSIKIIGSYIDIFQFLKSSFGYQMLTSIFDDNFDIIDSTKQNKRVLNEQEFINITTPVTSLDKLSHSICPICIELMDNHTPLVETCCGHHFHRNCLKKWLTIDCHQPNCPMCRNSFI